MRCLAIGTLVLALFGCAAAAPAPPAPPPEPAEPAPVAPAPAPPPPCGRIVYIEVHKSERTLHARCARGARVEMRAAMGREPLGTKRRTGDLRTPEGRYRISGRAEPSRFHAFVPIDYPSVDDADRALSEGRIGARDHARIVDAHARGVEPPSDTALGGGIGLHGEGKRWAGDSEHLDWTLGCVAVTDRELDFLIARIEPGVPVVILP